MTNDHTENGQAPLHAQAPTPQQMTVAPKNPGLALVASFFVTGLGQLLNGQAGKGILMFALQIVNVILMFVIIGFFTGFAVWVWSVADAYLSAQKWNREHGVIS